MPTLLQQAEPQSATHSEGSYERRYPGGTLAVHGAYEQGLPSGTWQVWREDGSLLATGTFAEGRRSGKWEFTHANGQLAAVGNYLLGCRDRRWVYFDQDGVKREDESGLYRVEKENHPNRSRKYLGETLAGVPHGSWSSWWPDGVPQTVGSFEHGVRSGELKFFLLDGSFDREFISGVYAGGERAADAVAASDPFAIPEEAELAFTGSPTIDLAGLPRAVRAPNVTSAERDSARQWVDVLRAAGDEAERRKAELVLVQQGRAAVPEVLEELRALDLNDSAERELGARFSGGVLRGIAHAGFEWDPGSGEAALATNRLAVLRWYSWWELVRENEDYWSQVAAAGEGGGPALLDLRWIDGPNVSTAEPTISAAPSARGEVLPELFAARRKAGAGKASRKASEDALSWLARHQSPEGGWSAAGFAQQCGGGPAELCTGSGLEVHDLGVTSLALLAFLANGNTAASGAHSAVVTRGLAFLLAAQNPQSGLIGNDQAREFLYHHALATEVLAEVALFDARPEVSAALQLAVDLIVAARNPKGAWRYSWPPNGENDSSVTSWMVTALVAAEHAGIKIDSNAYAGARWWFAEMTDPTTGRIGYDTRGGASGRLAVTQAAYPPDLSETMTAAGLHAELAMGVRYFDAGQLQRSRDLIYQRPPLWNADGTTNDFYYWFHGAQALRDESGRAAKAWRKALQEALGASQRTDRHRAGSWDPNGPWGFAGGRVYSTALGALALQAEWRHPR